MRGGKENAASRWDKGKSGDMTRNCIESRIMVHKIGKVQKKLKVHP